MTQLIVHPETYSLRQLRLQPTSMTLQHILSMGGASNHLSESSCSLINLYSYLNWLSRNIFDFEFSMTIEEGGKHLHLKINFDHGNASTLIACAFSAYTLIYQLVTRVHQ
jgi:hypothetical protein